MAIRNVYVMCNYSQGMFSNEYFVKFKGSKYSGNLGGIFVMKEKVTCIDKSSGLVKAILMRKDEKTSQVIIPAITDDGHFFKIPNEEIVIEEDS